MKPFTKEDLDAASLSGCGNPGCTHSTHSFYIHSKCHVDAGLDVSYTHDSGSLHITCRECGQPIIDVVVAKDTL